MLTNMTLIWELEIVILIVPVQLEISYGSVMREIIKKTQQKEHHLRKIKLDWDQRENGMSDVKEIGWGEGKIPDPCLEVSLALSSLFLHKKRPEVPLSLWVSMSFSSVPKGPEQKLH